MPHVLGIDAGALGWPSWLAFLDGDRITLDQHVFAEDATDLPWLDDDAIACVAVDAPQGLPRPSEKRRASDAEAQTPTGRLPATRTEMETGRTADGKRLAYVGLVCCGVEVFWANREELLGLAEKPRLVETYPRAVFRALTGENPPSKRREPFRFSAAICDIMCRRGLTCPSVRRPSVDQCDAILCAVAAQAFVENRFDRLGDPPLIDDDNRLLREGYIILPQPTP